MTTEGEAQKLLREHKIERGPDDPRSCWQVAVAVGLVVSRTEVEVKSVTEEATTAAEAT